MRPMKILKPAKLKKGDLIGLISPASPIDDPAKIDKGVLYLESLGYRVLVGDSVKKNLGYLAGTDEERVSDIHAMFLNRQVKAIFCVRGGYGTPRLLRSLDYTMISRNPKILVGFSDITALQLAIWQKCRVISFHGPMVGVDMASGMDPFTEEMLWQVLTSDKKPKQVTFDRNESTVLSPGSSEGRLLGGNLSLLITLLGTPYLPDLRNSILLVEEIGEEPYRVDRMLTHLLNAGALKRVKAMVAGKFTDCVPKNSATSSRSVDEILRELAGVLRVPFLSNLPFGHFPKKLTLPIGLRVKVNATSLRLQFLEAAVV